ncbi:MAG: NADH-quinone oxidoreductase subunit A [Acidimicrobiales bacterium]|nr:NADH-quinone oxidoreductase subunit A [Acidimicrobiales bacterium]MDP6161345.1 NADH-quinone oxidoreductase subunit A [Acidimicrobiales bacterium]MDP6285915.1 NADH-quinone oxidoreductase subunit A [Acidimicrobiales bacterium]HJL91116.1 NADH-quinone oxidoreductase subunit A [Acidimicrobiales bacterium]HJO41263.1 NADH-quinone oxidoreductase subunit A [Acidimicrobiales bacterium]
MTSQYLPVIALFVLAVLFAALSFAASRLLAPRRPNDRKQAPYECGIIPAEENPNERFPVRFYLVAMIFIVFDIEIIFFYPWALSHRSLGLFGLVAVFIFALAVFESFIYLIGKGALEWGPNKQLKPKDELVSLTRNTSNTIRRVGVRKVGQEGRDLIEESFENQEVSN